MDLFTGPVGWSLIAANAVLISAQAFCWYQLTRLTARDSGLRLDTLTSMTLSAFLALYLNSIQWQVFGHNLVYVLLPLFLTAIWKCVVPNKSPRTWRQLAAAIGFGAALMLTHNSCVAFVGAAALMVAVRQSSLRIGVLYALLLVTIPSAIWTLVRNALDQAGSHPIGLGNGSTHSWSMWSSGSGSGELLVPDRYLAPLFVVLLFALATGLLSGQKKASALRFGTAFVAASLAILLAIFNLTWVANELTDRFLLYVPLLMLLPLFVLARDIAPRAAMAAAVLLIIPQAYWVTNWGTRQIRETLAQQGFPDSFVMPNVYLSRSYLAGPPVTTERGILISPLAFNDPAGKRTSDKPPEN